MNIRFHFCHSPQIDSPFNPTHWTFMNYKSWWLHKHLPCLWVQFVKLLCVWKKTLLAVLGHYRNRLQRCQTHLKDCTSLLQVQLCSHSENPLLILRCPLLKSASPVPQELTWSHAHTSSRVSSSSESVWPELLLQSNIEQVHWTLRDKQHSVVYRFRNPAGLKPPLCLRSLTRCRRFFSPWNNRPLRSRPTWRNLERGLRMGMQGPLLMLMGPIPAQPLHRRPHISTVDGQMMCQ